MKKLIVIGSLIAGCLCADAQSNTVGVYVSLAGQGYIESTNTQGQITLTPTGVPAAPGNLSTNVTNPFGMIYGYFTSFNTNLTYTWCVNPPFLVTDPQLQVGDLSGARIQ